MTSSQINFSFWFVNLFLRISTRAINQDRNQHKENNVQKIRPKEGVSSSIKSDANLAE